MNLDDAISAHQQWKVRLRMLIDGGSKENLDPAVVGLDNQCELGKWIHGPGKAFASKSSYADLKTAHAQFHLCASAIVKKAAAGDKPGAERALGGEYAQVSTKVVEAILKMKVEVQ